MAFNAGVGVNANLSTNNLLQELGLGSSSSLGSSSQSNSAGLGSDSTSSNPMSMIQLELELLMELVQAIEQQLQQMEQGQQGSGSGSGCGGGQGTSSGQGTGSGSSGGGQGSSPITTPNQPAPGQSGSPDSWYDLASGSSVGDPHLSFNGSTGGGDPSAKWNDMGSQHDLVDANRSFFGGYRISTQATTPDSNGVTYNKSATIHTGNGRDNVTMGAGGKVTVDEDGHKVQLQKGQSMTLSSGAKVTENKDGSVTVTDNNHQGGQMSSTLSWNGKGVDVNFNSSNCYLGGELPSCNNQGVVA